MHRATALSRVAVKHNGLHIRLDCKNELSALQCTLSLYCRHIIYIAYEWARHVCERIWEGYLILYDFQKEK